MSSQVVFEEARDFAGEDWEKMSGRGRLALLARARKDPEWSSMKWRHLPESVQMALVKPLIVDKRDLQERFNRRKRK